MLRSSLSLNVNVSSLCIESIFKGLIEMLFKQLLNDASGLNHSEYAFRICSCLFNLPFLGDPHLSVHTKARILIFQCTCTCTFWLNPLPLLYIEFSNLSENRIILSSQKSKSHFHPTHWFSILKIIRTENVTAL